MMWVERPRLTEFERLIAADDKPRMGLSSRVSPHFDPHSGLIYQRRAYRWDVPIEAATGEPTASWVDQTLCSFVRAEFGPRLPGRGAAPIPIAPKFSDPVVIDPWAAAYEYLESCERELVFDGAARDIARRTEGEPMRGLYELLTHPRLGNSANEKMINFDQFSEMIGDRLRNHERLLFVFPGFPFKDQNPFRTQNRPSEFDLAEVALLVRLHVLSIAIYQLYHMGADWIVLQDGKAFARALRVEESDVGAYQRRLRAERDRLDIGRSVSLVDYLDLVHFVDNGDGRWQHLGECVEAGLRGPHTPSGVLALEALTRGMKRNVNLGDLRGDCDWGDWWMVLNWDEGEIPQRLREQWHAVDEVAHEAAVRYASFNLLSKWTRLESSAFPNAIRATIHPKAGQIAVPKMGSEFPWNGTAFVSGSRINPTSVSVKSLRDLATKGRRLVPHIDDAGRTFFLSYDGV